MICLNYERLHAWPRNWPRNANFIAGTTLPPCGFSQAMQPFHIPRVGSTAGQKVRQEQQGSIKLRIDSQHNRCFPQSDHEFLTIRGLWCDCGGRFAEPETQSHAQMVSREIPNQYLWSHVQRVPAVSVWQHYRPANTGDSLLIMPHRSKKEKVKLFSCALVCGNLAGAPVLCLSLTLFCQESSKLGRSKKSGGKNGPADDQDVSMTFKTFRYAERNVLQLTVDWHQKKSRTQQDLTFFCFPLRYLYSVFTADRYL